MTEKQRQWFYRTRDPEFLWKLGIGLVLAGFVLGWLADGLARVTKARQTGDSSLENVALALGGSTGETDIWASLETLARTDFDAFLATLPAVYNFTGPFDIGHGLFPAGHAFSDDPEAVNTRLAILRQQRAEAREKLLALKPGPDEGTTALRFWDAMAEAGAQEDAADPQGRAIGELRVAAEAPEPARHANWAWALYLGLRGQVEERRAALEREARLFPEAERARQALVGDLVRHDPDKLAPLLEDPVFKEENTPGLRMVLAKQRHDWGTVFLLVPLVIGWDTGSAVLAIFSGAVWFTLLLRFAQTPRIRHPRTGLGLLAVVLGVLSVWPTIWCVIYQEAVWDFTEDSADLLQNMKYYIAGVALREELCKLLLFAPLGIYLARDGDGVEILALAGCVGLGFAVQENINYFTGEVSAVTVGRFLTANVMHIMLTGILGLSFCRAIRHPAAIGDLLGTFTIMVMAHGLYDLLLTTEVLGDYAFLYVAVLVYLSYQYFGSLHNLLDRPTRYIYSLSSIFIGGLALIFSFTLVVLAFRYGIKTSATSMYFGALADAILIIVFLRQFREVKA
jgi:RsiW-degrading membrane proteinase PrsW (M82 family)